MTANLCGATWVHWENIGAFDACASACRLPAGHEGEHVCSCGVGSFSCAPVAPARPLSERDAPIIGGPTV